MKQKIKLLNVGYPKVGNTWLGRTLSYALNAEFREYGQDDDLLKDSSEEDVLRRIGGDIEGREKTEVECVEKTHLLPIQWVNRDPELKLKVVYLTRDPRDVAVSYYYYTYFHRPHLESGSFRKCSYFGRKQFLLNAMHKYRLPVSAWKPYADAFVSYEDRWENSESSVVNLLANLDVECDANALSESVRYFSWSNMSEVYRRDSGKIDNKSFLRSGVTGSYRSEFDLLDHLLYLGVGVDSTLRALKRKLTRAQAPMSDRIAPQDG